MFDSLFTTAQETIITPGNLILALVTSLALGLVISLVYIKTHKAQAPSQSFSLTLIMLPAVITVIILLVGGNVARAFSLAGAFSIIRFRSTPGDPKDITYVLFTMAVGLAAGMGYILYAVFVALILCGAMALLEYTQYGKNKSEAKHLKITVPENLDFQNAFADVLAEHTISHCLQKVKTTELGSLYELVYTVVMKNDREEKAFLDALRCRNGNLSITLVMAAREGDF